MNITTSRLLLRLPEQDDRNWIFALNHDPLWLRFIGNRGVHTLKDARVYIDNVHKHFDSNGYGLFVIEDRLTGEALGMCGLINRGIFSSPDLGFALLSEAHGKGVALEACQAVVEYARDELGCDYLTAMTHLENVCSQALLNKLGFERRGRLFMQNVVPQAFFWLPLNTA